MRISSCLICKYDLHTRHKKTSLAKFLNNPTPTIEYVLLCLWISFASPSFSSPLELSGYCSSSSTEHNHGLLVPLMHGITPRFQYLHGIWNPMDILIPEFYFLSIVGCMCHSTAGNARCPEHSLGVPQIISDFFVWGFGIFVIVMVCIDDPIVRSCTRDPQFPIHFKLNSEKNSVRGMVEVKTRERHHGCGI
jgi:hypothetical protein